MWSWFFSYILECFLIWELLLIFIVSNFCCYKTLQILFMLAFVLWAITIASWGQVWLSCALLLCSYSWDMVSWSGKTLFFFLLMYGITCSYIATDSKHNSIQLHTFQFLRLKIASTCYICCYFCLSFLYARILANVGYKLCADNAIPY